jgi:hypothetical protein
MARSGREPRARRLRRLAGAATRGRMAVLVVGIVVVVGVLIALGVVRL